MDIEKIIRFNKDQYQHVALFQELIWIFVNKLIQETLRHDESKLSEEEYEGFLNCFESMKQSKDGYDKDYQEGLKTEAIKHHVTENPHHAEYWNKRNKTMPIDCIIAMYFDGMSRSIQKGADFADFVDYNIKKLPPHEQTIYMAMLNAFPQELMVSKLPGADAAPLDNGDK